jgi:hypothetical protein
MQRKQVQQPHAERSWRVVRFFSSLLSSSSSSSSSCSVFIIFL